MTHQVTSHDSAYVESDSTATPNRDQKIAPAPPAALPAATWKALAPRMAPTGRASVRLIDPESKVSIRTARITEKLPIHLAAVPLYTRAGRTAMLAFDFDAKPHGQAQVDVDVATLTGWLTEAGARIVTDRSTSGGRHVLVPLAAGTTASFVEVKALMTSFAARLKTLDITPNINASTGALSVPGTVCAGGGHRILDGPLTDAVEAFTVGSDPALLPNLHVLVGALPAPRSEPQNLASPAGSPAAVAQLVDAFIDGVGADARLADRRRDWRKPLAADVAAFAATGTLPRRSRWKTSSEARESVVINAVLRGDSATDIASRSAPGQPWEAFGALYTDKHGHRATEQLQRDVDKALRWAIEHFAPKPTHPGHGGNYTHPPYTLRHSPELRVWLAHALAWADREFASQRIRWVVRDVLQALAVKAAKTGDVRAGTPVVAVGGRSLALSAGLVSDTTTFEVLAMLRAMVGAPIVRVRQAVGRTADAYALTTSCPEPVTPVPAHRARIRDVHPAWSVLGRHNRAVYEAIVDEGLRAPADIYAAAHIGERAGQRAIADLAIAGLVIRHRGGRVTPGALTLEDIAATHHIDEVFADRIERNRAERALWWEWLDRNATPSTAEPTETPEVAAPPAHLAADDDDWADLVDRGPPDIDDEAEALELCRELVGAHIIATTTNRRRLSRFVS